MRAIGGTWGSGLRKAPCTCDEKRLIDPKNTPQVRKPGHSNAWPWHRESVERQIGKLNQMKIMELDIGNDDGTLEYMRRGALSSPNTDTCLRSLTPYADLALCFADRRV